MQLKKQQLEPDMEQQTGCSKLGEEYVKCVLSPCLFNFYAEYTIWNARLNEAQAGIKIARRNINNLRYADDTTHNVRNPRGTKEPLDEGDRVKWKKLA